MPTPPEDAPLAVRVRFLRDAAAMPMRGTAHSAGYDLCAALDADVIVPPGARAAIPTGLAIEIGRPGVAAFVFSRSGLGARDGLTVAQGVGVIDPDYRGEIKVWLMNTAAEPRTVRPGQRIAQLLFLPVFTAALIPAETLSETDRGAGGFGHTGE
ncbi:dUTP diphosphatase [Desulfolutivibrio sulfoxidireducens]|uniref:dUTP diphosphatase n=1 Tax=Desulfolutivibrio sulfoxidireducens TaxID=2773299 RepID=UPI00159D012C|nr:dUTP diphosphatase [Desulfolutivibrio sulfoxidireducens]QLA17556.1 dUTP diphosphatase [Desulfolutivibrio sulfoxidireducens]QLA21138.1 dUTP diphosphatase [Desulfolutivibrio sulfoxidireducens]